MSSATARYLNVVLGVWLFISAFLWPHSPAQFTNSWLVGLLCVAFALVSLAAPRARYLNAALAGWLFISSFALTTYGAATVWNNALASIGIFILSLLSRGPVPTFPRRAPRYP